MYNDHIRINIWRVTAHTRHHHDDVTKWKHFPRHWPFLRGIHRSPVNSPHKGQSRGILMFSLICTRIYCWVNNREAVDLRRHRAHYDAMVMIPMVVQFNWLNKAMVNNYILQLFTLIQRCNVNNLSSLWLIYWICMSALPFASIHGNQLSNKNSIFQIKCQAKLDGWRQWMILDEDQRLSTDVRRYAQYIKLVFYT